MATDPLAAAIASIKNLVDYSHADASKLPCALNEIDKINDLKQLLEIGLQLDADFFYAIDEYIDEEGPRLCGHQRSWKTGR